MKYKAITFFVVYIIITFIIEEKMHDFKSLISPNFHLFVMYFYTILFSVELIIIYTNNGEHISQYLGKQSVKNIVHFSLTCHFTKKFILCIFLE